MLKSKKGWLLFLCSAFILTASFFLIFKNSNHVYAVDTLADTWSLTDNLGRSLPAYKDVGPKRDKKYVGIFYSIWHNDYMANTIAEDTNGPRNIHQIIAADVNNINNTKSYADSPAGPWGKIEHYHYWGKPLFDYYDPELDSYVIRKHAQMLIDIGVDTLILDLTNFWGGGVENLNSYHWLAFKKLADVFTQIRSEGGRTPQFAFNVTWNADYAANAIQKLYTDIYSQNLYQPLWFQWEGKPLIVGSNASITDSTILSFFTFRSAHPEYTAVTEANRWPWLQIYPQSPAYTTYNSKEHVVAGVAQNWNTGLSSFTTRNASDQFNARGRSYRGGAEPLYTDPTDANYKSNYGFNFQEGLGRAVAIDPDFLMITQWNEWIAARFAAPLSWDPNTTNSIPAGVFYDAFTAQFSRDIEPTREGGLGDSHYNQLAAEIRRFKGITAPTSASGATTIAI
ncbi:MAG TPA: hypothetical protein VGE40_04810, partial [Bacilli bacterium]